MSTPIRCRSHWTPLLACALAILAAGCSAGAQTPVASSADAVHEAVIATAFALNPLMRDAELQVEVRDGRARLSGTVENPAIRSLAYDIARHVEGVTVIDNGLRLDPELPGAPRGTEVEPFGSAVDDATITATIRSKLLWSRHEPDLNVEVITREGRVILRGLAATDAARVQAQHLARTTRGVGRVDNQVTLRLGVAGGALIPAGGLPAEGVEPSPAAAALTDAWITSKVLATLHHSSHLSGREIDVTTTDGVVVLIGILPSGAERALAISLAENVLGVRRVQATRLSI